MSVVSLGESAITRLGTFPHPRTSWGRTVTLSPGGDRVAVVDGLRVRGHALQPDGRDVELALPQPAGRVHHGAAILVLPGADDPCVAKP